MLDPGEFFTSLASIATLEAVSVANIDSPTELNSQVGAVNGERRVAYQAGANDDVYTVYHFDSADGSGASSPYVLAASGSGFWIAVAGKYVNSAVNIRSTLAVTGAITGSSTVSGTRLISTIAIGTAPLTVTSTTVVPNLNVSQLLGGTWAAPGTIGSGTPSTGAFTTLSASGATTFTGTTASMTTGTGTVVIGNGSAGGLGVGGAINAGGNIASGGSAITLNSATDNVFSCISSAASATLITDGGGASQGSAYYVRVSSAVKYAIGTNLNFGSSGALEFTYGSGFTLGFALRSTGSVVIGAAALATSATDGFLYIPTCAGTPTGAPTAFTGRVAITYDTTNNIIYVYNGAWKKTVALT